MFACRVCRRCSAEQTVHKPNLVCILSVSREDFFHRSITQNFGVDAIGKNATFLEC